MNTFDSGSRLREREKNDEKQLEVSGVRVLEAITQKRIVQNTSGNLDRDIESINVILSKYIKLKPVTMEYQSFRDYIDYQVRSQGVMYRVVKLTGKWNRDAYGCMLGICKDTDELVALVPAALNGYRYYDTSLHRFVRIDKNNLALFSDEALVFSCALPNQSMSIRDLNRYCFKMIPKRNYALIALFTLLTILVGYLLPLLTSVLFGSVLNSHLSSLLFSLGFYMLMVIGSKYIFFVQQAAMLNMTVSGISRDIEASSFMRLLLLPVSFHRKFAVGDLTNRVMYISVYCEQLLKLVLSTMLIFVFSMVYLFQIFYYSPMLLYPVLAVLVLSIAVTAITVPYQLRAAKEKYAAAVEEDALCYSIITGMEKIRSTGSEKCFLSRWHYCFAKDIKANFNPPAIVKLYKVLQTGIMGIGTILIFLTAYFDKVSVSDYIAFVSAFGILTSALNLLCSDVLSFMNCFPMIQQAKPILEAVPENSDNLLYSGKLKGDIRMDSVSFSYEKGSTNIFDRLNLHIHPGEYVGIVGRSGCGKSTLIQLMLGYLQPNSGNIYFDQTNIANVDIRSLRKQIGTVLQEDKLFPGTIRANIMLTSPNMTDDDVWEALRVVDMEDYVRGLSMGLDTIVADGVGVFSGGQRQKIIIARAIATKPNIIILDEATSALDNITQKTVSDALANMHSTRITIAHRLSTVRNCDRILVLDKGCIAEEGNYDELMAKKGLFSELVSRQQTESTKG